MNELERCLARASLGARELRILSEGGRMMCDASVKMAEVLTRKDRVEIRHVRKRAATLAEMASAIDALVRLIEGRL